MHVQFFQLENIVTHKVLVLNNTQRAIGTLKMYIFLCWANLPKSVVPTLLKESSLFCICALQVLLAIKIAVAKSFFTNECLQSIGTNVEPINRCISNVRISGIVIIKSTTQNSNNINIRHFIFDMKLKLNQMTGTTETSDDEQDKMWFRVFTACHSLSIPYSTAQLTRAPSEDIRISTLTCVHITSSSSACSIRIERKQAKAFNAKYILICEMCILNELELRLALSGWKNQ